MSNPKVKQLLVEGQKLIRAKKYEEAVDKFVVCSMLDCKNHFFTARNHLNPRITLMINFF